MEEWDGGSEYDLDDSTISLLDDTMNIDQSSSIALGACATQSSSEGNATHQSDAERNHLLDTQTSERYQGILALIVVVAHKAIIIVAEIALWEMGQQWRIQGGAPGAQAPP